MRKQKRVCLLPSPITCMMSCQCDSWQEPQQAAGIHMAVKGHTKYTDVDFCSRKVVIPARSARSHTELQKTTVLFTEWASIVVVTLNKYSQQK